MSKGDGPSFVAEDEDGNTLIEVPLRWDPRDPPSSDGPPGDFAPVIEALDQLLQEEEETYTVGAKLFALVQVGESDETVSNVARRFLDLVADQGEDVQREMAQSRLMVGGTLRHCGQLVEAERALSDVASFYASDPDPFMRTVAAFALRDRIRVLGQLGDADGIVASWGSLCAQFAGETRRSVRVAVAGSGRSAAGGLFEARRPTQAIATADDVIRLYGSDTEAKVRSHVAAALMIRIVALPRWRFRARGQAFRDLLHFVGDNPEPEVIDALNATSPRNTALTLRLAHDESHHHKHE